MNEAIRCCRQLRCDVVRGIETAEVRGLPDLLPLGPGDHNWFDPGLPRSEGLARVPKHPRQAP